MERRGILVATTCLSLAIAAGAQAARPYRAPRTVYGQPDLQGTWTNVSVTRLERSPGLPLTLPPKDEPAYEKSATEAFMHPAGDEIGQRGADWQPLYRAARIAGRVRTSWIVSPDDGRLPYRSDARERLDAKLADLETRADDPESRPGGERCLTGSGNPPMLNPNVTGAKQIVQTRTEVAILAEANHDVRIVRLGAPDQPPSHVPASVRPWMGDSIGHWEGDTLVVETTNFHAQETFRGAFLMSANARITERFTRVSKSELLYSFEVDDPSTYTQVWRGEMPFLAETKPIHEYACHEGNYSMTGILAGARYAEATEGKAAGGLR